jgi:DNA-binding response OmpR family regulator
MTYVRCHPRERLDHITPMARGNAARDLMVSRHGQDGLALCRALKLGASDRHTYVMMFTIRSDAADILLGIEAGVDDYVVKGAGADDLLARIAAARSVTRVQHSPHAGF